MATTLRDIGERLGLSTALVSRVLNNKPGVWASEETRRRVLEAAREMNYRPSAAARALVTGRTMQLAISTADADWQKGGRDRLGEVVGFVSAAAERQYRVLVMPSPEWRASAREFEGIMRSGACDGFCVYAEQATSDLYDLLRETKTPYVVVGNPGDPTLPQVDQDNYRYAFRSVKWLHEQGRRRIGFAYPGSPTQPFIRELRRGYTDAMAESGLQSEPWLIPGRRLNHHERIELMRAGGDPSAFLLLGVHDLLRWRASAASVGMRVPDDVTFLAHIDPSELGFLQPGDAYHVHDPELVGAQAGRLLIAWCEGQTPPGEPILVSPSGPEWFAPLPPEDINGYPEEASDARSPGAMG